MYIYTHMCAQSLGHVQLFVTSWTVDYEAFLSIEFFRQEYWSGLPLSTLGDLLDSGIESVSPASPALARGFFTTEPPEVPIYMCISFLNLFIYISIGGYLVFLCPGYCK